VFNLAAAVAVFISGHVLFSGSELRESLVRGAGERVFRALFSLFAIAALVWVVLAYRAAPHVPVWEPPHGLRWVTLVLTAFAIWLVVAGTVTRSGALAVTRHPMLWGIVAWAVGHLLARGDLAAIVLFGGFGTLAFLGSLSQDRKKHRRLGEDWDRTVAATSNLPFAAVLAGARLAPADLGWRAPLVALAVFVALVLLHPLVFGVRALPW
jgi:uncharacterized membrane protein